MTSGLNGDPSLGPRRADLAWDDPGQANGTTQITNQILSIDVNYTMDLVCEISVKVHDPGFLLSNNHYFAIGRHVWFRGYTMSSIHGPSPSPFKNNRVWQLFEIGNATMSNGPGSSAVWDIKLRPGAVQQLKRDKSPARIGGTGSNYIRSAANAYGLRSFLQHTVGGAETWKAQNENEVKESVWDVMGRIASSNRVEEGHAKFLLFEVDGVIFFATQRWLLGKWGMEHGNRSINIADPRIDTSQMSSYRYVEMAWPPHRDTLIGSDTFQLMSIPKVSRTDNAPIDTTGSLQLDRFNARALRPGMTIFLNMRDCNYYNGMYLITTVSFEHIGTGAVAVNFRSPERIAKDIRYLAVGPRRTQVVGSFSDI